MKNLKLTLVALTAILFLGMSNVNAQEQKTVVIKTYEFVGAFAKSKMVVTDPSGKTTMTIMKTLNWGKIEDIAGENSVILQDEINKWKKEGYTIDALTSGSTGQAAMMVTTVVLSKKE